MKSERSSSGKTKGENNARNGNRYLTRAFIEASTYAARYDPAFGTRAIKSSLNRSAKIIHALKYGLSIRNMAAV